MKIICLFPSPLQVALVLTTLVLSVPASAIEPDPSGQTHRLANAGRTPAGLSSADWAEIRQQYERRRHTVFPVGGGHAARNPGQRWETGFDGRGFTTRPLSGGWDWGLELRSYGWPGHEQPVGEARVSAEGPRVTYDWDDLLQEWFVNDARGLEHGFTLRRRPSADCGKLVLNLAVRGGLRPEVWPGGEKVRFVDGDGVTALTYSELRVRDAEHRSVPAHFQTADGTLGIVVEDDGASYPLVIDPIAQQAYLKAATPFGGEFGVRVAVSGDTVVVGAPIDGSGATGVDGNPNDTNAPNSGAAYVFVRSGGTNWAQQAYLKASNADREDYFGSSVAISGDIIVVGAPEEDSNATGVNGNQNDNSTSGSGAAYVFVRSGTNWSQQAYLKASNRGGEFGWSVAVSGETVVVSAIDEDSNATGVNGNQAPGDASGSGAAYVFVRSGTTWSQQAYLKASNTGYSDFFGISVAISGNTIVIGAHEEDSNATGVNGNQADNSAYGSGAAYVFVRNGTTWSQQAYLKASNSQAGDQFGGAVAISDNTVVIGARLEDSNATGVNSSGTDPGTLFDSGAAYVFVRDGFGQWSQQAYLKASNTEAKDVFGASVAISGDTIVVGAPGEDSSATGINGYQRDNSSTNSGAAYVFVRDGSIWSQQAYLKASNTGGAPSDIYSGDSFGVSVAISGPTVVVGAYGEQSGATGVNGDQADNSVPNSGAAYVFTGLGKPTSVSQLSFSRAPNPGANDQFGYSLAVWGDTAVVGAPGEASNATGINGNQNDNSAPGSGAAYVFVQSGGVWHLQAYLKAFNAEAGDYFGRSVAISGDTIVVGANFEDSSATGVNGDGANNSAPSSGAAYVYVRNGTSWTLQAYLKASNTGSADEFGLAVAISGDTIVVGAYNEDSNATGVNGYQFNEGASLSGAAYVFVRNDASWSQQAYLKASYTGINLQFGKAVAVSGDTIAIGAPASNLGTGEAYVFVRTGTVWSQQASLLRSNPRQGDSFGFPVAAWGDLIVVGAPGESSNATGVNGNPNNNTALNSGAAYVFARNGTTWSQQAYLKASNTGPGDFFGWSVAAWGDTVVVGAKGEASSATGVNADGSLNNATNAGAAYVFARNESSWSQQAYLKASNASAGDNFGLAVATWCGSVLVGAPFEHLAQDSYPSSGAFYSFTGAGFGPRLSIARDGTGGYFIRFNGTPGCTYLLQRSDVVNGSWIGLNSLIAPASGAVEYHETSLRPSAAFYRAALVR